MLTCVSPTLAVSTIVTFGMSEMKSAGRSIPARLNGFFRERRDRDRHFLQDSRTLTCCNDNFLNCQRAFLSELMRPATMPTR